MFHADLWAELNRLILNETAVERPERSNLFDFDSTDVEGVRVLLAEDNIVNQKVVMQMMSRMGCRVDVAANGVEAVDMWRTLPYDMIFMDCQMPELDGLTATQHIRAAEEFEGLSRIPIIAMTANAMQGDQEACFDVGMDDYTTKPIRTQELARVIAKWKNSAAP